MGRRGITRPRSERKAKNQRRGEHEEGEARQEGGGAHGMRREERLKMPRMHHQQTLRVSWTVVPLGAWTPLDTVEMAGLARAAHRLKPVACIKGAD